MIAKKFRLSTKVWATQRHNVPLRVVNTALYLIRSFKTTLPYARVSVVVSTKVDKRATIRNAIRRAIYDAFQARFDKLPIADYTCVVKPGIKSLTRVEIINKIEHLLDELFI